MTERISLTSPSRKKQRELFIERLGLERMNMVEGTTRDRYRIERWRLPAVKRGRRVLRYERTMLIVIYPDESWRPYLSLGGAGVDEWIEELEAPLHDDVPWWKEEV